MGTLIDRLKQFYDQKEVTYEIVGNKQDVMVIKQTLKVANTLISLVFLTDHEDDSHISVKLFNLCSLVRAENDKALAVINNLNESYRWFRITMDENKNVIMSADAIVSSENVGDVAFELAIRALSIADDIYPTFMKLLWG